MVPGPQLTPALYAKHQHRAVAIAEEYGGTFGVQVVAMVALWEFCSQYTGGPFVKLAEQSIRDRLQSSG